MLGKGINSLIPNKNLGGDDQSSQPEKIQPENEVFFKDSPLTRNIPLNNFGNDLNQPTPPSQNNYSPLTPQKEEYFEKPLNQTPTSLPEVPPSQIPEPPSFENQQPSMVPSLTSPTLPQATPEEKISQPNFQPEPQPQINSESKIASPVSFDFSPNLDIDEEQRAGESVFHIEVEKIKPNPFQPRRHFNEDALRDLASSIREFGVIQPLVVTKVITDTPSGADVEYELIAGERRLLASKKAGLERVPVIIRKSTPNKEKLELAIIENLQRENLNPIESARAFSKLQDEYGMTQREIGARLGKSREVVANSVRLLSLPTYIQEAVETGKVGESQARLLISITNLDTQQKIFEDLIKNSLSVRELRNRVISTNARTNAINKFSQADPEIKYLEETLSDLLGTKVKVDKNGNTGKITISFSSPEELKGIIDRVKNDNQEL